MAPPASMKPRMSFFVTRPPRPVPEICDRSTPCSAAIRATTGETKRAPFSWPSGAGGCAAGGGTSTDAAVGVSPSALENAALSAADSCVAGTGRSSSMSGASGGASSAGASGAVGAAGVAAPSGAITAIFVPTSTVSPSWTRICCTMPDAGLGTSVSTLSVEISSSVSSASIGSPTALAHFVTVPSETETPIWGMTTSTSVPVAISTRRPRGARRRRRPPGEGRPSRGSARRGPACRAR